MNRQIGAEGSYYLLGDVNVKVGTTRDEVASPGRATSQAPPTHSASSGWSSIRATLALPWSSVRTENG
jgi:hypothetical protein